MRTSSLNSHTPIAFYFSLYYLSFHIFSLSLSIPLLPVETGLLCSGCSNVHCTLSILHHNLLTLTKQMKYKSLETGTNNVQNTFKSPQTLIFILWSQEFVYTFLRITAKLDQYIFQSALQIDEVNDVNVISKQQMCPFIFRVKSILFTNDLTNSYQ